MKLHRVTYVAVLVLDNLFRFIPLWCLYGLADFFYILLYHVAGYRKKVVFDNLRSSFPGKKEEEIRRIAQGFYRHFCDLIVESIKGATMKEESVVRRFRMNPENMDQFHGSGRHVICVGGHYGNWEWSGNAAGMQLLHKPVGFYKPLSNPYVNRYMQRSRVKGRSVLAPVTSTLEAFRKDWGEPAVFYMIADQSPSSLRHAHWVKFLNQDTATLHGPEKYARLFNLPVVFADIQKIRRGMYFVDFRVICADPSDLPEGEITRRFMSMLEERIVAEPRYYLWSHRRWKHKREVVSSE